jgi:serine/threonine protein kinase
MVESPPPMFCSKCGAKISVTGRFCSSCGEAADPDTGATVMGDEAGLEGATMGPSSPPPRRTPSSPFTARIPRTPSSSNPSSSSDPIGGGRFTPGQIIAQRYRVVALAGRGGMGEVYRAEDLTLGQVVALKFLPEMLSQDAAALARFHVEVRTARQVSHPNVCRVFDIGEADGILFLTMEYVDGEDLASVVRRIGRLSPDKATEIARQICAGLAAAHERGVIHRDLKPANVMLDGAGKIRVTDFGLAGIAASIKGAEIRAGTPAYMAPEQLAGRDVSTKSDIYSLGLILYEILTGKRAFEASTLPELMKLRESGTITNPSTLVRDLDPLIERVILRCLELEPEKRPSTALQVAAALPGGDPLAAALAAGETPSPEMVAASGQTESMRPRLAVSLLALTVVGLIALLFVADRDKLHNRTPLDNPPEVLAARGRKIIQQLGYTDPPADEAYSFQVQSGYLDYLRDHDKTQNRWAPLRNERPASIAFWYRQSPREMSAERFYSSDGAGVITRTDPRFDVTGMVLLILDTRGHLLHLEVVPPQKDSPLESVPLPNWPALFAVAGLDASAYHRVDPEWMPLAWSDSRAAWLGAVAGRPDTSERIEAAAYRGKPIYFDVIYPWSKPERSAPFTPTPHEKIANIIGVTLFFALALSGVFVTRRNFRLNRADTRGATRLGTFVLLSYLAMWLLRAHHLASIEEFFQFLVALSWALLATALVTVLYLALEPFVRRREPHTLISWSRLLAGQLRDPLVGRDFLIGTLYGVGLTLFEEADTLILPLFGKLPTYPGTLSPDSLLGIHHALGDLFFYVLIFVLYSLMTFFFLFLLRLAVKKDWIAAIVVVLVAASTNTGGDYPIVTFVASALIWLSIVLILTRFGLLALVVGLVVQNVLQVFPMTSHLARWYAPVGLAGIFVIVIVGVYGFYASLGGKPIFSVAALDT